MAWAIVARRALLPSTPRAQGAPLRASGVDRSARPSKCLSCQQCEKAPLGLPRSIFNRQLPEVSITEICYQFRVSHMGCSPERTEDMGDNRVPFGVVGGGCKVLCSKVNQTDAERIRLREA